MAQGPFWVAFNYKDDRSEDRLLRKSSSCWLVERLEVFVAGYSDFAAVYVDSR
jgi:hypothetical protein